MIAEGPVDRRPIAAITGASRGLGATLARFLAGQGYDLLLSARRSYPLNAVASELAARGSAVTVVSGDVADEPTRQKLRDALPEPRSLDLLVNNASELGPSPLVPLLDHPLDELEHVFRVNVAAPIALVRTLRAPLARARGLVVNISSDAAVGGYPKWGGYGASKAALDLASRTLAEELKPDGIAVVTVDPGDMRTEMHQAAYLGEDISDRPLPDVTLPFWAWLLHQPHDDVSGHRFRAQADAWGASA